MLESKKSILYSLIMKTIMTMFQAMPDNKVMRVADATSHELVKELAL